jgi:SNF2 family DNA or RNA helicase
LISAELKNNYYVVRFKGEKRQFTEYINKVMSIPSKKYNFDEKCWMIPKEDIVMLQTRFKDILYLEQVDNCVPKKVNASEYQNIGAMMKLQPYDYQKQAIKFAIDQKNALIILPCGSGKTPIGIGTFLEARESEIIDGPGLIVVKASLKTQWVKEIEKFSDLSARIIKTPSEITLNIKNRIKNREKKLDQLMKKGKIKEAENLQLQIDGLIARAEKLFETQFDNCDLFVLNYETLKEDAVRNALRKKKIKFVFADEIHYVKSKDADRSKALYEFSDVVIRIGATATPIKKNYEDVFGLFKFICPTVFPTFNSFAKMYIKYAGFGRIAGFRNEEHLQKKIAPYLMVKTKDEISDQLPKLIVMERYCHLTQEQQEASDRIMTELDELNEQVFSMRARCRTQADIDNNPELAKLEAKCMALQTFAQEMADSPELLTKSDSQLSKQYAIKSTKSAKLEMLANIVEEIIESGEKVCVFTRYERMHNIMEERIKKIDKTIKVARVSGSMNDKQRYAEIYDKFRDNDEYKVLLGTDSMAEGANLSKCQYVVEFDLAESYAIQTQRHGRIERADSIHKTAYVYQLIAYKSWDEIQKKIVEKKEGYDFRLFKSLAKSFVGGKNEDDEIED